MSPYDALLAELELAIVQAREARRIAGDGDLLACSLALVRLMGACRAAHELVEETRYLARTAERAREGG